MEGPGKGGVAVMECKAYPETFSGVISGHGKENRRALEAGSGPGSTLYPLCDLEPIDIAFVSYNLRTSIKENLPLVNVLHQCI